jgi:alkyl hydroperoxide reductase subunit AhpF
MAVGAALLTAIFIFILAICAVIFSPEHFNYLAIFNNRKLNATKLTLDLYTSSNCGNCREVLPMWIKKSNMNSVGIQYNLFEHNKYPEKFRKENIKQVPTLIVTAENLKRIIIGKQKIIKYMTL